ncbi:MAG TPA: type IIL restriction-modification enzyme MmeI, partial [Pyrinomonadaceae bacterium]
DRYVATVETSKHRFFVLLDRSVLPDNKLVNIALNDAYFLGVLSSRIHVTWALAAGSRLGVGNDPVYVKTACFEKFPFPDATDEQQARIRELGEALDAHRKRQQAQHPRLTVTEMYNVLEKLRAGESLTDKDRLTHEAGLVSVLRQIHDRLDAAVSDAYGWSAALTDEEILERLVRLNAERAGEERRGLVRWLRPGFQRPAVGVAAGFGEGFEPAAPAKAGEKKQVWPKTLPEQARALRQTLAAQKGVVTPEELARKFTRARVERVEELLRTLVSLGQAREVAAGRYAA